MRKKTVGIAGAIALAGSFALAGPASADPKPIPGEASTLTCGGQTYDITVAGNGDWTPAHDSGSTQVFIPVAFGETAGFIYAADDDALLDSFSDNSYVAKSGKRVGQGTTECTFEFTIEPYFDETYGEEVYGSFGGFVTGKTKKA